MKSQASVKCTVTWWLVVAIARRRPIQFQSATHAHQYVKIIQIKRRNVTAIHNHFFFLHKIQCVFFFIFWLNGMREMHEIDVTLLWTRFFLLCLARFVFYSSFLLSPRVHFFWCVFRLFIPLGCFLLAYYCILLFPVESQHQE